MIYRNRKTGATFESPCECRGEEWEREETPLPAPAVKADAPAKTKTTKKGAAKK